MDLGHQGARGLAEISHMPLDIAAGEAPSPPRRAAYERAAAVCGRLSRRAILWAHAFAERRDWLPADWGEDVEVDMADAGAVAAEWRRQLRLWAAFNPEEALAWKVGAGALGVFLVAMLILVGHMS